MSNYKGLNNPSVPDMLKTSLNTINDVSHSARLYGRLFAYQDMTRFIVGKLEKGKFSLRDLQQHLKDELAKTHKQIDESENRRFGHLTNQK